MANENLGRLEKLRAKRTLIEAQIKGITFRENEKKRRLETRKKILAGAVVLSEAEKIPDYKTSLYKLLKSTLTRPDDRTLFGLPPLPDNENSSGNSGAAS